MGDVQAHGHSHSRSYATGMGPLYQGFPDGVQDDETGVAEYGNGHDPAHDQHRQGRILLPYDLYDAVGHLQGRTGLFQQAPYESPHNDDDPDAGKCAGEPSADHIRNPQRLPRLHQRDSADQAEDDGDSQDRQERMDLVFGNGHNHKDDSKNKHNH